jgi:hypothetical protein
LPSADEVMAGCKLDSAKRRGYGERGENCFENL